MKFSSKVSKKNSAGFIISLEFLLVMALVVIPLFVGLVLLGQKLVTLYLNYQAAIEQPLSRPVVWDSSNPLGNAKPVGPVIGYDQFEAPLVLYRDATPPTANPDFIPGVLLGVRPNRFTTVSKVYYGSADCTGTPYIVTAASGSGEVGFLSQMQGVNYAVGNGNILYRETIGGASVVGPFASTWTSQNNEDNSPETYSPSLSPACSNVPAPAASGFLATDPATGIVARPTDDTAINFVIVNNAAAVQAGTMTDIHYYASQAGTIQFLLLDAGNVVQWLSPPIGAGIGVGVYSSPGIGVLPGWRLGYYATANAVIPFTAGGGPGSFTPPPAPAPPVVVGNTLTLSPLPGPRTYSFGADIVGTSPFNIWVAATEVARLGTGGGNFVPPFRVAFPTAAPGPGLPPKVCPGSEGCP